MDKMTWFLSKPLQVKHAFFLKQTSYSSGNSFVFQVKQTYHNHFSLQKTGRRVFLPSCRTPRPPNAPWPGVQLWNSSGAAWASKLSTRSSLKRFGFCSHTLQGTNLPYPTKRVFSPENHRVGSAGDGRGYVVIVLSKRPSLSLGSPSIHPSIHPSSVVRVYISASF